MSRRQDIRTDVFGGNDLLVLGGDFVVDEADVQHAQHLIESEQGHYKQWPLFGVGARRLLNGPANGEIRRTVQLQLVADGHESPQVGIDVNEKIIIRL